MKTTTAAFLIALGLALPTIGFAQDSGDARPPRRDGPPGREFKGNSDAPRDGASPGRRGPAQDRSGDGRRGPGVAPLFAALDANHDGVIDETEMKQAAAALAKLDKNGDGKLTPDEVRPQRPEGDRADGPADKAKKDQGFARPRGGDQSADGPRRERGPRQPQER